MFLSLFMFLFRLEGFYLSHEQQHPTQYFSDTITKFQFLFNNHSQVRRKAIGMKLERKEKRRKDFEKIINQHELPDEFLWKFYLKQKVDLYRAFGVTSTTKGSTQ